MAHNLTIGLIGIALSIRPQLITAQHAPPDFFEDRGVLEFVLVTDFSLLLGDREQDSPDRPAEVGYFAEDGSPIWIPIAVQTRGKFRLDEDICSFPPLRLDFPARRIRNTVFDGQNKLKMVTHCQPDPSYQQHIIQEYLAYRMYETLTPKSLRTRLVRITYVDASETVDRLTRYAFLIEDVDDMAFRNGAVEMHFDSYHALLVDEFEMGVHDVFQYMIGNTDWSMSLNQNVKYITDADGNVSVVPFDFDWSGLVSAPYAEPATDVTTKNVQERFYMGVCRQNDHLTPVFEYFLGRRTAILDIVSHETALTESNRRRALSYLDDFFDTISDEQRATQNIRDKCLY